MTRTIKLRNFLFLLFLSFIALGVIKDKFLDSPEAAYKKVEKLFFGSARNGRINNSLHQEREVIYNVYFFSILPVGKMHFRTQQENDGPIYSLQVTTIGSWINRFIEANASVESHSDRKSCLTKCYLEKTNVRGKIKTKKIVFDRDKLIAERDDVKMQIPENMNDPVGAFIQAITASYMNQKVYEFKFLSKEQFYTLKSTMLSEKSGLYELCLEMFRDDSSSSHGARVHVWVTADNARIPVLFKSWMPAGYGSVVINSMETKDQVGSFGYYE